MPFYVLCDPPADSADTLALTDYMPVDPVERGEPPRCPECSSCLALMLWLAPRKAQLETWADRYGDIAFGPTHELLVSDRFAQGYRKARLRGLGPLGPVEIARVVRRAGAKPPATPPQYLYALPVLSAAKLDADASGMETENPYSCDACRSAVIVRYASVVLEHGSWGGEDIFFARGLPGVVLTSERFADWFHADGINSGMLVPALEYAEDLSPKR